MLRYANDGGVPKEWKRINMRSVAHLIGVEFIHDLYNRYDPRINAVRFRHTITTWKDGVVNSYAPLEEWEELGSIVGGQYYELDPAIIGATRSLYKRKRKYYHRLMRSLRRVDWTAQSNEALASKLLNFQSLVLGELYVLNFVQVEHGLATAIRRILSEKGIPSDALDETYVSLIRTEKPTESQKEKIALGRLASLWEIAGTLGLYREKLAQESVRSHCRAFSHLYSAYGENPRAYEDFWEEFEAYRLGRKPVPHAPVLPRLLASSSRRALKALKDEKLDILVPLLVCGGVFRDKNKALLGKSLKHRFAILNEIAKRDLERRESLDYYLLAEIGDLLRAGKRVSEDEIACRMTHGVMLTREENFALYAPSADPVLLREIDGKLAGQCASPGACEGKCKIVLSKEDAAKVEEGDIMIAIGTDFDLIEAMYRSSAVITEEGGILSHASVVCRELGKPCCIGVKDATRLLKDGQRVRVDATHGTITVL